MRVHGVCPCVYVCAPVCVCVRAGGWLRGIRGLRTEPASPPALPSPARPAARPAPYLQAPLCLLQRERRIDTADGAGAAASRPPLNVCVCARVAASSSPSPEPTNANTPPRHGEPGGRPGKRRAKSEPTGLDSSSGGVQGGQNVQQKGREMRLASKHPFPHPPSPGARAVAAALGGCGGDAGPPPSSPPPRAECP